MKAGEKEEMEEDMAALRQLLENLVTISFNQEKLTDRVDNIEINTPAYTDAMQEQQKIKDDFKIIDDSLQELSKRVFQIRLHKTVL